MHTEEPEWDGDIVLLHYGQSSIDDDDESINEEIAIEPEFKVASDYMERHLRALPDGGCLIGYLSNDTDCQNPIESCDQMGKIIDCSNCSGDQADGWGQLGFDQYRDIDLDACYAIGIHGDSVSLFDLAYRDLFPDKDRSDSSSADDHDRAVARALELYVEKRGAGLIGNPLAVALDYFSCSQGTQVSVISDDEQFSTKAPAGVWIPESEGCAKAIREEALQLARKYCAPTIVRIERSALRGPLCLARYTLANNRVEVRLENSDGNDASCFATQRDVREQLRSFQWKVARKWAAQACGEYEKWANGDCWGVCVERYDAQGKRINNDCNHCWGFVGSEYAQEELRGEFDFYYALFSQSKTPNQIPETSLPLAA